MQGRTMFVPEGMSLAADEDIQLVAAVKKLAAATGKSASDYTADIDNYLQDLARQTPGPDRPEPPRDSLRSGSGGLS